MKPHARSDDLQCCWRSWEYIGNKSLRLNLPQYNIPDMGGAIRIAEVIMPDVQKILVYCASVYTLLYAKGNGEWKAYNTDN
jgi:hypothetical protein